MKTKAILLVTALALLPVMANAAGSACNGQETQLVADGRLLDFDFIPQSGTLSNPGFYRVDLQAGRSYVIEVRQDFDALNTDFSANGGSIQVFGPNNSTCTGPMAVVQPTANTLAAGSLQDTGAAEPYVPQNATRYSLITTANGGGTYRLVLTNSNATTGRYVSVRVAETTYFSPAYTQNGNYITFYSFFNTTSQPITGTLTLTPGGAGSPVSTTLAIPAGKNASTNTQALQAPTGGGTATFAHNGPPGALLITTTVANFSNNYVQPIDFKAVRE